MQVFASAVDASYAGAGMDYGAVKRAGYSIVLRYLGSDSRCLTAAERDRIYAAGLRLGFIGQRGQVDRPRGGYAAGREDGAFYEQWADRMGVPGRTPILCAIGDVGDPDGPGPKQGFPLQSDLPAIGQFLQGLWETISRPVGIYGPYWVLEHFRNDPRVFCYWQSAGGSGSGAGTAGRIFNQGDGSWRALSDRACMYQEYGSVAIPGTDHNAVLMADFGTFTHHPTDAAPERPPEEDLTMKAVFCPDQTGGTGWRAVEVKGRRYREGYGTREDLDLDLDTGLVDGEVNLPGARGQRFLDRYPVLGRPEGAFVARPAPGSTWSTEVGGPGRHVFHPSGIIVPIHDDHQAQVNAYVGVLDLGEIDDAFFYNGALVPWSVGAVDVAALVAALGDIEVSAAVGLTPAAVEAVAARSAELVHADLAD